jgi:hypothetical protein
MRNHLYFATAPGNTTLFISFQRNGIVTQLPVVQVVFMGMVIVVFIGMVIIVFMGMVIVVFTGMVISESILRAGYYRA